MCETYSANNSFVFPNFYCAANFILVLFFFSWFFVNNLTIYRQQISKRLRRKKPLLHLNKLKRNPVRRKAVMWKRRYGIFEFVSFKDLSNFCFHILTVAFDVWFWNRLLHQKLWRKQHQPRRLKRHQLLKMELPKRQKAKMTVMTTLVSSDSLIYANIFLYAIWMFIKQ